MDFVREEIQKIRNSILSGDPEKDKELYAAQQALEWLLQPNSIQSPFNYINGIAEDSEGYSAPIHRPPSSDISDRCA